MNKHLSNSTTGCSTLVELLRWRALQPDRPAYTFLVDGEIEEARLTYGELDLQARAIGALLQSVAVAGERVLLLYPPGLEFIAAFFGCLYAGMTAVPCYPPRPDRPDPRLQAVVVDAQATTALTTTQILSHVERRFVHTPDLEALRWLATDGLGSNLAEEWQDPAVGGEALAFLQYTSGSTAVPKGVMVSHGSILYNERMIQQAFGHTEWSTFVGWLPVYHDMGLIGNVLQPLYIGAHCVLMSPLDFLQKPLRWLQAISRYKARTSGGPNFAYDLCVRKITPEQRAILDLSSWEVAFNGAEPVRHQTLKQFAAAFEPCGLRPETLYPCYGLAEATLFVSGGLKSAPPTFYAVQGTALGQDRIVAASGEAGAAQVLVGCGRTWLDQKIVIVDPKSLTRCPPDQVGEIWVSGPNVAQGYWNRPEETEHTFRAHLADTGEGPFLRTGDLGFLKDGELFVTGRLKDLIIIRGCNHYPQDIELTVQQSHPALRPGCGAAFSVDVADEERLVVVQELRRDCRNPDVDEVTGAIRRAVAEEHELHVYAVVVIEANTIPKTSSGKIRRHACQAMFLQDRLVVVGSSILDAPYAMEGEESLTREALLAAKPERREPLLRSYLQAHAAQVLRVAPDQLDPQRPLVTLGIDSLMAVELQNRVEAGLGVVVPAVHFLEGPSVAQLAAQVLDQLATAASTPSASFAVAHKAAQRLHPPPVQPIPRDRDLPLSPDQERLWFLDQLTPGNAAYHIATAVRFTGQLDIAALEQSLNKVLQRHEALRTTFLTRNGRPIQVIAPTLTLALPVMDLRGLPETEREAEARRLAAEETGHPFDLTRGPLIRAAVLRVGEEEHVAVLTTHHIISDAWSMGVLLSEVAELYGTFSTGKPASLPKLSIQYADFACWQRLRLQDDTLEDGLAYWERQLAGAPPVLALPTDRPRPSPRSFRGDHRSLDLPSSLSASLRELSSGEGVTLFMTLLAAFKTLLYQYSWQEDILVGSPASGRLHPETQKLIGFFAYPIVLRTDLSGDPTFRELLARVREAALGAYAHQAVPFARVVEIARPKRTPQYHPLFQVMFSLLDQPLGGQEFPGLASSPFDVGKGATDYDLFLTVFRREEGLHGVLEYNTDLFVADTIDQLIDSYCGILEQCIQHPGARLSQFELSAELMARARSARMRQEEQNIVIAATFTAEPVEKSLAYWMRELGIPSRIQFAPYNQVFQQLLDPSSLLSRNDDGVNVILVRFEDWTRYEEAGSLLDAREESERNVRDFVLALKSAAGRSATPHLVCVCPASPAHVADADRAALFEKMKVLITSEFAEASGVYVVTTSELSATYPVSTYHDPRGDELGHIPFTPTFFTALGTMIARRIYNLQSAPYKVIVMDCDQTLWKGICGEDGPLGVEIDPPRRALQEFMVAQHDAGMLICLCSKNNEEDVVAVFDCRRDMPLKWDHIVSWRVNWRPKSENIRSLADELQLGLDGFIFIDDDPVACAEVRASCPDVLTLQLPQDPGDIPRFLNHVWAFDHLKVVEEDHRRTALYRQNMERERFLEGAQSLEDFLASLGLEVQISEISPRQIPRVAQLTQRTNQFNLTMIRRSEVEIQKLCQSGKSECLVVEVSDRFGEYGLVGVIIFEAGPEAVDVDTFLLSCRALGRGVEHRMLARLGEVAVERRLDRVDVPYIPTRKNQPAIDFLDGIGSQFKQPHPRGDGFLFRFPAGFAAALTYSPPVAGPSSSGDWPVK